MITSIKELFEALINSSKPSDIKNALGAVGDSADISVNQEFGDLKFSWEFYAGNESNLSTINIGSKPARSIVERITNAIDAVLEKEQYLRQGDPPSSPMEAAKRWFGRPPTSYDTGIFTWKNYKTNSHDRHIHVVLLDGDKEENPTIDILDDGIGIHSKDFHKTILSLHQGNKIKKKYLAGAFGQGGASSLAYCDYTLIVSRHVDNPKIVSFTLIKLLNLPDDWKEDAYVYLTVKSDNEYIIPEITIEEDISLYKDFDTDKIKEISIKNGTLVRSIGYSLEKYNKTLSPSPGNLYHLLHYLMVDPLLPFRLIDIRTEKAK